MKFSIARIFLMGILITGAVAIPAIFHYQVIPMIQTSTLLRQVTEIQTQGNSTSVNLYIDKMLKWIKSISYNTQESDPEKAVFDITINIPNNVTGIEGFPMYLPEINLGIYYKAGYPFYIEKEAILGWRNLPLDYATNLTFFPEPGESIPVAYDILDGVADGKYFPYDIYRWIKVISLESPYKIIPYGSNGEDINLKLTFYGGPISGSPSEPHALSQFIGTLFRYLLTNRTVPAGLIHIQGSAKIFGMEMPIDLDAPEIYIPLNITEIVSAFMQPQEEGGVGGGVSSLLGPDAGIRINPIFNISDLITQIGLFDIQNYKDLNHNFQRDYNGVTSDGLKNWTEPLFENGAFTISILLDLAKKIGIKNLNIQFPESSCDFDAENTTEIWNPPSVYDKNILNELFFYLPKQFTNFIGKPDLANRIFGLVGFIKNLNLTAADIEEGNYLLSLTLRLLSDIRDPNFNLSNVFAAFLQGLTEGLLGVGIFGSVDLQLGSFPLSLLLNLPLNIPISPDMLRSLSETGGGQGIGDILGGFLSDPLHALHLKSIGFNGLALDTYQGLAQLNTSIDMDLSLPFGLYLPTEIKRDENGNVEPYLGIGGGPITLYVNPKPSNWDNMTQAQKDQWLKDNKFLEIPSLDDPYLQESIASILIDIAKIGQGQGIAYHFDDGIVNSENPAEYGNLLQYYNTKGELPPPAETKTDFSTTMDQILLNLSSLIPKFGNGFFKLLESIGIDRMFIEYMNNSMPGGLFNHLDRLLEMNLTMFLNMLYQPGPQNDLFDYLIDSNKTYTLEPVVVQNATYDHGYYISMKVAHSGLLDVQALYDEDRQINYWDTASVVAHGITNESIDGNWTDRLIINANGTALGKVYSIYEGMVTINCTGLNITKLPQIGDTLLINYTANKLDLFSISNLLNTLLSGGGLSFGSDTETTMNIVNDIPNLFASMGIDLDKLVPELIKYLRVNISDPVKGYGIKPFEMLDVANIISSMESSTTGGGSGGALGGLSQSLGDTNMINAIVESVVKKILSKVDPFQLMNELIGNPLPWLDYMNRSKLFTKSVILRENFHGILY
ncbi:MAG: hypothetical protein ACTSPQ_18055 [Candidatus Helarchaeota archaeon]